ncbi:hypothetical protein [Sphingobacterium haloxyli]|uniref:hypothetical protein n=1 Tax=Sphingobacterium haloxyli TaxID=2100533 RepID=UPI0013FDC310|nr:hypothetical protein [Sphingobacterium haloxyli]
MIVCKLNRLTKNYLVSDNALWKSQRPFTSAGAAQYFGPEIKGRPGIVSLDGV